MKRPEVVRQFVGRKRPGQAAVATKVNSKRWVKEDRVYVCGHCKKEEIKSEVVTTKSKTGWCCSKSCYYHFKHPKTEDDVRKEIEKKTQRAAAEKQRKIEHAKNMGRKFGKINGEKSREKLSRIATGRTKIVLPDGTSSWSYPLQIDQRSKR